MMCECGQPTYAPRAKRCAACHARTQRDRGRERQHELAARRHAEYGQRVCERCEVVPITADLRKHFCDGCRRDMARNRFERWASKPGSDEKRREFQQRYRASRNGRRFRLRQYGLTEQQYDELLAAHNNACAICLSGEKTLVIDHDHVTGKVRGILCRPCNAAVGHLGDSEESVMRAINYLRGQ